MARDSLVPAVAAFLQLAFSQLQIMRSVDVGEQSDVRGRREPHRITVSVQPFMDAAPPLAKESFHAGGVAWTPQYGQGMPCSIGRIGTASTAKTGNEAFDQIRRDERQIYRDRRQETVRPGTEPGMDACERTQMSGDEVWNNGYRCRLGAARPEAHWPGELVQIGFETTRLVVAADSNCIHLRREPCQHVFPQWCAAELGKRLVHAAEAARTASCEYQATNWDC